MPAFRRIAESTGQIADIRNGNTDDLGSLILILGWNRNFVSEDMQSSDSVVEMESSTLLPQLHPVAPVILISFGYFISKSRIIPPSSVVTMLETVTVCLFLSTLIG